MEGKRRNFAELKQSTCTRVAANFRAHNKAHQSQSQKEASETSFTYCTVQARPPLYITLTLQHDETNSSPPSSYTNSFSLSSSPRPSSSLFFLPSNPLAAYSLGSSAFHQNNTDLTYIQAKVCFLTAPMLFSITSIAYIVCIMLRVSNLKFPGTVYFSTAYPVHGSLGFSLASGVPGTA